MVELRRVFVKFIQCPRVLDSQKSLSDLNSKRIVTIVVYSVMICFEMKLSIKLLKNKRKDSFPLKLC